MKKVGRYFNVIIAEAKRIKAVLKALLILVFAKVVKAQAEPC